MKQFTTAARRGTGAVPKPVDVTFEFEVTPDKFQVLTAHPPTTGQIALFLAAQSDGGMETVRSLFDFLAAVLDDTDFDVIENQLRDGLDVDVVVEIISYLIEEWGARPTAPVSGLSPSRRTAGRKSTGRPRAVVSTTSSSASTGS